MRRRWGSLRAALGLVVLAAACAGAPPGAPPADAPPAPGAAARILFSKAEGYFHKGLYRESLREYSALLALDSAHAGGYRSRATAHAALRQDPEALADYHRAIELAPQDDDAWLGRGLFHFARGRFAEALDDFDRAIALDPGHAVTHLYRARACEKIGRFREAGEARQAYIHCTLPSDQNAARERPPVRELRALGLE